MKWVLDMVRHLTVRPGRVFMRFGDARGHAVLPMPAGRQNPTSTHDVSPALADIERAQRSLPSPAVPPQGSWSTLALEHPFVDGNKRIGFTTAVLFLELNGYRFTASEVEATLETLALAARDLDEPGYAAWLKANARKA